VEVEMQTHAEHQQHDPDVGELFGDVRVRHPAGSERAANDAGDQITDDGGKPKVRCYPPTEERGAKADSQIEQQALMMHSRFFTLFRIARQGTTFAGTTFAATWQRGRLSATE
jgi:hypothetical protein